MPANALSGLGFPPPLPSERQLALRTKFTSSVITYKNSAANCIATNCAIYVPSELRNQPKIDLLLFFHGLDTCTPHYNLDPNLVIKNFQLIEQLNKSSRKVALAVPMVPFIKADRDGGFIRTGWSAAYLNSFVEEILQEIGKFSRVRPSVDKLILSGHSAGYDILIPLAEQFDCGNAETRKGALAKLSKVLALDIPHGPRAAKALVDWARSRRFVQFSLVFAEKGDPPTAWQAWRKANPNVSLPANMQVTNTKDQHCELPAKYINMAL
jgi:hypothetical protein